MNPPIPSAYPNPRSGRAFAKPHVMDRAEGRVVVITGASAGVGRAAAREFARAGDRLALIARGAEGLKAARLEAERLGAEAIDIQADVSDFEEVEAAAAEIESSLGAIEVWVNNAMSSVLSPAKQMHADEYRRVTEVTYLGYVNGSLAALKRMLPRDHGTIIQVGSALAYRAIPLQSAYCAGKHAIKGFTQSLRCELMHDKSNVKVTMVNLPAINTPQFEWVRNRMPRHPQPVPPIYQPEIAAKAIYWTSLHPRRELNVAAVTSLSLIANKLAPGLLDRYLARTNYQAQQTDQLGREHEDNLFVAVDDDLDIGAHGSFDTRSKTSSVHLWLNTHRALAAVGAAASAMAALGIRRRNG